jgi:hypothetical protein
MAQYIRISGRSANERIEAAIPRLLRNSRRVHNRAQATAVAIRMESQGRLKSNGTTIAPAKRGGLVGPAGQAARALLKVGIPTATITRAKPQRPVVYDNAFAMASAVRNSKRTKRYKGV